MHGVQGEQRGERDTNRWLTFKEAGQIMGKSSSAVRMWVKRRNEKGESVQVKKERGKCGEVWYIHSSAVNACNARDEANVKREHITSSSGEHVNLVTLEYYDEQRKIWERERDELRSGLMMYQYKFEEADRQLKLLPAPVEVVSSRMQELEARAKDLEVDLEAERKRSWWKKFLGLK